MVTDTGKLKAAKKSAFFLLGVLLVSVLVAQIVMAQHNEGWTKGLSEAEAKVAAKHADELTAAGKVSDAAFGDLTKTKLGQHTLKSADATTELLAKQSKLVQKWGVKKADDVVSKGGKVAESFH